jgi:hypothetical protein
VLRKHTCLSAIVTVLAVAAVAASAAMAGEAPFYNTGKTAPRLTKGEKRELTLKAEGNQILENKTSKTTITCTTVAAKENPSCSAAK